MRKLTAVKSSLGAHSGSSNSNAVEAADAAPQHGCSVCSGSSGRHVCLFMPDWRDSRLRSEKYFLNTLIRENDKLTRDILDTFIKTDILKWETLVYLDHVEPYEECDTNLEEEKEKEDDADNKSPSLSIFSTKMYERPLTPLETIYVFNKIDLVVHPVVRTLIDTKNDEFARNASLLELVRRVVLVVLWSTFAVYENYAIRHYYGAGDRAGKLILVIFVFCAFALDVFVECRQFYFISQRLKGYKRWVIREHRRFNDTCSNQIQVHQKAGGGGGGGVDVSKYSLIEKEFREMNNVPMPYKKVDNVYDWFVCLFQLTTLVTHLVDIGQHTNTTAQLHAVLCYSTVLLVWARWLLTVHTKLPWGCELNCMMRLIIP